ncbi:hypothetical protein SAY86_020137 [Trapa natans]|uniref:Peroxiredoxin-like 2A n=1 Tax=Trapa natans TaxID=22666 RepID=A0AAN7LIJ9_TRANT|nr:hypothetical protein SAY86_020137 [Trapa natans]
MASFSMEEFVGDGCLKKLLPRLLEEGWDDVPTLKLMNSDDMATLGMTQQQKDSLRIRSYLHDRALMQYADKLDASGKGLPELLNLGSVDLFSRFGMKRGHIARFLDRTGPASNEPHSKLLVSARRGPSPWRTSSTHSRSLESFSSINKVSSFASRSSPPARISSSYFDRSLEQSLAEIKIKEDYVFKGILAAGPVEPRACGCVQPPQVTEKVAPYYAIENISVKKLMSEYKIGMEWNVKAKTATVKASELWRDKPAVLLCMRRPGCIMCRAEAHQLYSRKPIFDALGVQLFAILHEHIESEVKNFWPRYWGGVVLLDRGMEFFKALGGGKLMKDSFISGFLLNPIARANYRRAKAVGVDQSFKGEGEIKGGLFIVGSGKSGIAYQFIERNFGDWAPIAEVIEICTKLQIQRHSHGGTKSSRSSNEFD